MGLGGSVASVNITFFSIHDLRPAPRPRSALLPLLRTSIRTATSTLRLLYRVRESKLSSKLGAIKVAIFLRFYII